jgi:hypothetical protein
MNVVCENLFIPLDEKCLEKQCAVTVSLVDDLIPRYSAIHCP